MRVLFASGIDGFCHRYAVLHWAEQLATQGIASTVRAHCDPRLATDVASHDVTVFYRVPFSPWIAHLLGRARAFDRPTIFAVDDLIFCPEIEDVPSLRRLDDGARRLWQDGVARYRRTLLACDVFLTTSGPLAEAGRTAGKRSFLHRAGLGARELALATTARATLSNPPQATESVRLGYFSGTPSHDDDFAIIVPVLAELLERYPLVELVIAGHLNLDPRLTRFGRRVTKRAFLPWTELPPVIATADVNLAPLEYAHPLVAAKGAVKYLEAAAVSVPTVASPSEAFCNAIRHRASGMLASDSNQWRTALEALVNDRRLRARLGAAARADVETRFTPETQGRSLAAFLAEVVVQRSSPPADTAMAVADEVALARTFAGEVARAAREPQARPGFAALECSGTTPPVGDGMLLTQPVRASHDGFCRIDVHTITYGLALDHEFELALRRDDGTTVATTTIPAALVPDRDWLAFEFTPEPRSAGHRYTLEICARGTGFRNALSLSVTGDPGPEGTFALAGIAGTGSLALRTFAAEDTVRSTVRRAC